MASLATAWLAESGSQVVHVLNGVGDVNIAPWPAFRNGIGFARTRHDLVAGFKLRWNDLRCADHEPGWRSVFDAATLAFAERPEPIVVPQ